MKDMVIGWCHHTIDFWQGCDKIAKECRGCYAEAMMKARGDNFNVVRLTGGPWLEAERLNAIAAANNRFELVFTCSMSDSRLLRSRSQATCPRCVDR